MTGTSNVLIACWSPSEKSLIVTRARWHWYNYWNQNPKWLGHSQGSLGGEVSPRVCASRVKNSLGNRAPSCPLLSARTSIPSSQASESSVFILPLSCLMWGSLHFSFKEMICWRDGSTRWHTLTKFQKYLWDFKEISSSHSCPQIYLQTWAYA